MQKKKFKDQGGDAVNRLIKSLDKRELKKIQPGLDKIDREERTKYQKGRMK